MYCLCVTEFGGEECCSEGGGDECIVCVLQGLVVMSAALEEVVMSTMILYCLCVPGFGGDEC